ncbi:hypothetical protein MTO96_048555 [Rhipicephalus appendiculatus]
MLNQSRAQSSGLDAAARVGSALRVAEVMVRRRPALSSSGWNPGTTFIRTAQCAAGPVSGGLHPSRVAPPSLSPPDHTRPPPAIIRRSTARHGCTGNRSHTGCNPVLDWYETRIQRNF